MSYDLFFKFKNPPVTFDCFDEYFSKRTNYSVGDNYADYRSHTGVYFSFNWEKPESSEEGDWDVHFKLNYVRPRVFALEAEPEISAFVNHFDLNVDDPQESIKGSTYSKDGFFKGWIEGNKFANAATKAAVPLYKFNTLPGEQLATSWLWNFHQPKLQEQLGQDFWVSPIIYLSYQNQVQTAISWVDAIPCAIPEKGIDLLVLGRQTISDKRRFLLFTKPSTAIVQRHLLNEHIRELPIIDGPVPYWLVSSAPPPTSLVSFFNQHPELDLSIIRPQGLQLDAIVDKEDLPPSGL